MTQIHGGGDKNWAYTAAVDAGSRLWVNVSGMISNLDEVEVSVTTGSESVIVAGSVQPYSQLGSVEIWQGGASFDDFTTRYSQRIDYEDKNQPVYMGLAQPGINTGSAGWQIRKHTFSGTSPELIVGILFGSGNTNFDKVWDDRSGTGESYI